MRADRSGILITANFNRLRKLASDDLRLPVTARMSSNSAFGEEYPQDDPLITAQKEFLSGGSQPAAKVVRNVKTEKNDGAAAAEPESANKEAPEWYKQMKGVRFQLDDLPDDRDEGNKSEDVGPPKASLIGDIVERKVTSPPVFTIRGTKSKTRGFPAPRRFGQRSLEVSHPPDTDNTDDAQVSGNLEGEDLMKEIDRENREKLARMSEEEILELQRSLKATLPPSLQEKLLQKDQPDSKHDEKPEVPAPNPNEPPSEPASETPKRRSSKTVRFQDPEMDMDDQSFDAHLRTFFDSQTTSVPPPDWTIPVHPAEETFYSTPDNSTPQASTMRFDFNGHHIPPDTSRSLPTHLGLHHHSLDPGSAGYSLPELAILARSVQPSQKCIALKIIGGVLADVASGKYKWDVNEELWDEIERERIIEILLSIAKGGKEMGGHKSVQRYAEDAVSKWVNAGGPQQWEQRLQQKGYVKIEDDTPASS